MPRALKTVPAGLAVADFKEMLARSDTPAVLVDFCTAWSVEGHARRLDALIQQPPPLPS